MNADLCSDPFDICQMLELGDPLTWISLISGVLGIVAFVGWVVGFRPRVYRGQQMSFIDYESNQIFEETPFRISWGHVFFLKKIKLARIEREATFKVFCKPLGKIKDPLGMDYYCETTSRSSRSLYLMDKSYFQNEEVEEVFLEVTKPAPEIYLDKIKSQRIAEGIEILNWNHTEIRNFPVELPQTITLDKMLAYSGLFNGWKIPDKPGKGIVGFVKSLPQCMGNKPGRLIIPVI